MVNKIVVGIFAVIILTAMLVGGLVGSLVGGQAGTDGPGNATATPTAAADATSTPTSVAVTPTATAADGSGATETVTTSTPATSTTTPTPTPTPLDERAIEARIEERINDQRAARGLSRLQASGNTAEALDRMARNHSETMAETQSVTSDAGGTTTGERYRANGLRQQCKLDEHGVNYPDENFEAVGRTLVRQPYDTDGGTRVNENEDDVARAIVSEWFESDYFRPHLSWETAGRLGVGIVVTDDGTVYATANVCAP